MTICDNNNTKQAFMSRLYLWWFIIESDNNVVSSDIINCVLFYYYGLTLIPAWISNYIHYNMWDEITYPFLNFSGCTVEV